MTNTYPDAWLELKHPQVRVELLAYLKDCQNVEHFHNRWDVESDVHFFFDDHDFGSDPDGMIGEVLFDLAEVNKIRIFTSALEDAIGPGKSFPDVMTVDWGAVVDAAKDASAEISKR